MGKCSCRRTASSSSCCSSVDCPLGAAAGQLFPSCLPRQRGVWPLLRVESNPRWLSSICCHFSLKRYESSSTPCNWQMVIFFFLFREEISGSAARSGGVGGGGLWHDGGMELKRLFLLSLLLYLMGGAGIQTLLIQVPPITGFHISRWTSRQCLSNGSSQRKLLCWSTYQEEKNFSV